MKLKIVLNISEITVFLLFTGLGTVANVSIFVNYICTFMGSGKKSIYLILIHLALTNITLLFSKVMPVTIAALGLRHFLGDIGCHVIVYLERMARGLSICTSSLLTVVQAVIMSPRASWWGRLRLRSKWHVLLSLFFLWILNTLISMNFLLSIRDTATDTLQLRQISEYCYFKKESQRRNNIFLILMVLRDAVFQGAMGGASGYMVFLLHKHHQHVLYLQNSKLLYRTPPEMRAAQSVLLLMLCFVFFYWTDCVVSLYLSSSSNNDSLTIHFQEFLTIGYAVLSPFMLIQRDGLLAECCHAC
uniref:Vomeronasal type-1 receptor n=1 Tax=Mus musculus musculus TaxID=39442 RepID=F6MCN3_MOUSE|nr:vomeronasal type 1 receptor H19 [Mus musculus musculus]AEF00690.1 vomeronasal type 1 receptor H19 [Mus musculus musculus]AEF00691.1 vomeronasal type 1 receptor H19 [Mus musculus musculus]AEF00692.1 vomeronasal type 1 receptor H19 [Mus musculus musculus]AEF00693.1 vomeronasal type 1 receptor H19 [Mus musculus musculus]